jgi:diadenylate cyclase
VNVVFGYVLQALILTVGIYVFLRFVRTTRGSRLVRGLIVSVTIGVLGLWGLAKGLELEELNYVFQSIAGYVVVIFAILFQPELRRGIAQLGEHQLVGRLRQRLQDDLLEELSKAMSALAARRHGALVAFERESPLNVYVEGGVAVDSQVTRLLLESIFYPGAALHDGAVVIRKDRVAAASCLFPLTKNPEFSRLRGTRHRAALGLTEETDAVTLAVSEETGGISLCHNGVIRENVKPGQLKELLRAALESGDLSRAGKSEERGLVRSFFTTMRQDFVWVASSFLIGVAILYIAYNDMSTTESRSVRLVQRTPDGYEARDNELALLLPPDLRLVSESRGMRLDLIVTGTRGRLDDLAPVVSGSITLDDASPGQRPLSLAAVDWTHDVFGVGYEWASGEPPLIELERYKTTTVRLAANMVAVDASRLEPRYEARVDAITFEPEAVTVVGPARLLEQLDSGELALRLQPLVLSREDVIDRKVRLGIHEDLARADLSFQESTVLVTLPIVPAVRTLGIIAREVALVCLEPARKEELPLWTLPANAQSARFTILTSGLLPAATDPSSTDARERNQIIRNFVEENLRVFVDVAELPPPGEGRAVPVRWHWRRDWRESLASLGLDMGTLGGREVLDVRLESEPEVLLEEALPPE